MTTEEKMVEKQQLTDKINDSDIMREAGKILGEGIGCRKHFSIDKGSC